MSERKRCGRPSSFYGHDDPPDRPSFPTRRSSDLTGFTTKSTAPARIADTTVSMPPCAVRSEEHTSELQSLAYLVCRLLLEKKNSILARRGEMSGRKRCGRPPAPRGRYCTTERPAG